MLLKLKLPAATAASSPPASSSTTPNPGSIVTDHFVKTDEDRDGELVFTDGSLAPDGSPRKLLLVGTGIRPGFEHKGEQAILAGIVSGPLGHRKTKFWYGPGGLEQQTKYANIQHWMPGLWKQQISPAAGKVPRKDDQAMQGCRAARIYNIFQGKETIEHAMTTAFKFEDMPAVQVRAPNGTRTRYAVKRAVSSDNEEELSESFIGGQVRKRQDKRRRAIDAPQTHDAIEQQSSTSIPPPNNAEFLARPLKHFGHQHRFGSQYTVVSLKGAPPQPRQNVYQSLDAPTQRLQQERSALPQVITSVRRSSIELQPTAHRRSLTASNDVAHLAHVADHASAPIKTRWHDALANTSTLHTPLTPAAPTIPEANTSTLSTPIIPAVPTIPEAIKPIDPTAPPTTSQTTTPPPTQPSAAPSSAPPTIPTLSTTNLPIPSENTSHQHPTTMSISHAFKIWSRFQPNTHSPQDLQRAITVLTQQTPPLPLLLRAAWACGNGQVAKMAEYPAYKLWMERNGVELRPDLEEAMAEEGEEEEEEGT